MLFGGAAQTPLKSSHEAPLVLGLCFGRFCFWITQEKGGRKLEVGASDDRESRPLRGGWPWRWFPWVTPFNSHLLSARQAALLPFYSWENSRVSALLKLTAGGLGVQFQDWPPGVTLFKVSGDLIGGVGLESREGKGFPSCPPLLGVQNSCLFPVCPSWLG